MRYYLFFVFAFFLSFEGICQENKIVKWTTEMKRIDDTILVVNIHASIEDGWHVYSQTPTPGGPQHTTISFNQSPVFVLIGEVTEPKPVERFEPVFNMVVKFFENDVTFSQKMKIKKGQMSNIKGEISFMACNDETCLAPEVIPFEVKLQ